MLSGYTIIAATELTLGFSLFSRVDFLDIVRNLVLFGLLVYLWAFAVSMKSLFVDRNVRAIVPLIFFGSIFSTTIAAYSDINALSQYHVWIDLTPLSLPGKTIIGAVLLLGILFFYGAFRSILERV